MNFHQKTDRRAFTLAELMIAATVTALIAVGMAALVQTVEVSSDNVERNLDATQEARLVIRRIESALRNAHATEEFPGFVTTGLNVSGFDFPDTIMIWSPVSGAVDPAGMPRWDELLIYFPDPDDPRRLIELRPAYNSPVTSTWESELNSLKMSYEMDEHSVVTSMMRTAKPSGTSSNGSSLACLRFHVTHTPGDTALAAFDAGSVTWESLVWPQDLRSSNRGVRQSLCRFEVQLVESTFSASHSRAHSIPFFGSGAIYYEVWR